MKTKELTFNQEERTIIAEYIFSYQTGVLIKGDALYLLDLFYKKELITEKVYGNLEQDVMDDKQSIDTILYKLIIDKIPNVMQNEIMKEYYGG